jgi:hypothetical protein
MQGNIYLKFKEDESYAYVQRGRIGQETPKFFTMRNSGLTRIRKHTKQKHPSLTKLYEALATQ